MIYDKILDNILALKEFIDDKQVVVFGTGKGGLITGAILDSLNLKDFYYVDNNFEKWNTYLLGKPIYSPDRLSKENLDKIIVLVASNFFAEISTQLVNYGLQRGLHVYSLLDLENVMSNNLNFDQVVSSVIKICGAGILYIEDNADSLVLADKFRRVGIPAYVENRLNMCNLISGGKITEKVTIILFYNNDKKSIDMILNEIKLHHSFNINIVILTSCTNSQRTKLENVVFKAGFRRHPLYITANNYTNLGPNTRNTILVFEKETASNRIEDMSSISGPIAEGNIYAYTQMLKFIKPNDDVIELDCEEGYGSYIFWAGSQARQITGISAEKSTFLNQRFKKADLQLRFRQNMLTEDNSVDCITQLNKSMDLTSLKLFKQNISNILRPGGRLIVSLEGKIEKNDIMTNIDTIFYLEQLYVQSYGDSIHNPSWEKANLNNDKSYDRYIAVYMKSPLSKVKYKEKMLWSSETYPRGHNHNYDISFSYPWIQHSLVTMGFRAQSNELIKALTTDIIKETEPNSSDCGASLCVLAYRLLEDIGTLNQNDIELIESLEKYICFNPVTPMQHRWYISCCYVLGEIYMKIGNWEKAEDYYKKCAEADFLAYSPNLATKCLNACSKIAIISYMHGENKNAVIWWNNCLSNGIKALDAGWDKWIGDFQEPLVYCFKEAEFILDSMSQACYALWLAANNLLERPAGLEKIMWFSTQFKMSHKS